MSNHGSPRVALIGADGQTLGSLNHAIESLGYYYVYAPNKGAENVEADIELKTGGSAALNIALRNWPKEAPPMIATLIEGRLEEWEINEFHTTGDAVWKMRLRRLDPMLKALKRERK